MYREIKEQWITALRSGRYRQTTGQLASMAGAYCCLGVLSVVAGLQIDAKGMNIIDDDGRAVGYVPIHELLMPGNKPAGDQAGLFLTKMNDGADGKPGASFAEIADWIEGNIPS